MAFGAMTAAHLPISQRILLVMSTKIEKETFGLVEEMTMAKGFALSRFDAKSMSNKKPTATEIIQGVWRLLDMTFIFSARVNVGEFVAAQIQNKLHQRKTYHTQSKATDETDVHAHTFSTRL